jgi:predicted enzyme related to lactoylglutathione lyase
MNTLEYFEIQSSNPEKAVNFYKRVFDWKITKDESVPFEYFRIQTDGMNGAILKRPASHPPRDSGTNSFTCSVRVLDFDVMSKKILNNGGQISLPKFAVKGKCWQGYFFDLDDNVFGLFQVDYNAK